MKNWLYKGLIVFLLSGFTTAAAEAAPPVFYGSLNVPGTGSCIVNTAVCLTTAGGQTINGSDTFAGITSTNGMTISSGGLIVSGGGGVSAGSGGVTSSGGITDTGAITASASSTTQVPFTVNGITSQISDMLDVFLSTGTKVFWVSGNGVLNSNQAPVFGAALGVSSGGTGSTTFGSSTCIRYNGATLVSAVNDCVVGLTAGQNIAVGSGTNPSVALTGIVPIANGGTGATTFSSSTCIYYNGASFASAAGNCVTGLTAGANISVGSGTTPSVALTGIVPIANGGTGSATAATAATAPLTVSGTFPNQTVACAVCARTDVANTFNGMQTFTAAGGTGGEAALVNGATTQALWQQFTNSSGSGSGYIGLESSTGGSILGGTNAYAFVIGTGSTRAVNIATNNLTRVTIDTTGNQTNTGTITATGFFNSSKRSLKKDIKPYTADPCALLPTESYTYRFKKGDNLLRYGTMIDRSPKLITNGHGSALDLEALAVADAMCIRSLEKQNAALLARVEKAEAVVNKRTRGEAQIITNAAERDQHGWLWQVFHAL